MNRSADPDSGLVVRDLTFGFGDDPLLDAFSVNVPPGDVHCVLGPSGSGKTTLLRLIAGLERPTGGLVLIDGQPMVRGGVHVPPERRAVGLVFQDFALFPNRTVRGNVLFGIRTSGRAERAARCDELLHRLGVEALADRMPSTLSGGEQQRVAIARALARRPRVMLLDEPFSSLDVETRTTVRAETMSVLRDSDVATLMVTHDPSEAELVADDVIRFKPSQTTTKIL